MPIDLNPPNFNGPGYLAGVREGSLNLAQPGVLGLQSLQTSNASINDAQRNNISRMAIQQQGQLGLLSDQLDQQKANQQAQYQQGLLADQQQKNTMQGQYQQGQLSLQQQQNQGQLANQQQQTAQQGQYQQGMLQNAQQQQAHAVQQSQFNQMMTMKKEDLMQRGAFATYGLLALQNAQSPDQAQQISNTLTQQAIQKGFMTQDEADQFNQLPMSQRKALLEGDLVAGGNAVQLKNMQSANTMVAKDGSVTLPDGSSGSILTPTERSATQKEIIAAQTSLDQFNKLNSDVKPSWFGAGAYTGPEATGAESYLSGITGVSPSAENKADYQKYSNYQSNANIQVLNIAKTLVGGRPNQTDLKLIMGAVPKVGPGTNIDQFNGNMQQLTDALQSAINYKKQLLSQGIKLNQSDASSLLSKALSGQTDNNQQTGQSNNMQPKITDAERQYLLSKGHTADEINAQYGAP